MTIFHDINFQANYTVTLLSVCQCVNRHSSPGFQSQFLIQFPQNFAYYQRWCVDVQIGQGQGEGHKHGENGLRGKFTEHVCIFLVKWPSNHDWLDNTNSFALCHPWERLISSSWITNDNSGNCLGTVLLTTLAQKVTQLPLSVRLFRLKLTDLRPWPFARVLVMTIAHLGLKGKI